MCRNKIKSLSFLNLHLNLMEKYSVVSVKSPETYTAKCAPWFVTNDNTIYKDTTLKGKLLISTAV